MLAPKQLLIPTLNAHLYQNLFYRFHQFRGRGLFPLLRRIMHAADAATTSARLISFTIAEFSILYLASFLTWTRAFLFPLLTRVISFGHHAHTTT